jgi:hypothetical protein
MWEERLPTLQMAFITSIAATPFMAMNGMRKN